VPVSVPGDPGEPDGGESADQPGRLRGERTQAGVFDLPPAAHLLDHELGVHPGFHLGGAEFRGGLQAGDQAAVLCDVVGGGADRCGAFGEHFAGVRGADHRAVSGRTGVAPGSAVCFDDDHTRRHCYTPDSLVRTMIRRHSSQRTTSFGSAARIRARSAPDNSSRHPPHRPAVRRAAPSPLSSRIRS